MHPNPLFQLKIFSNAPAEGKQFKEWQVISGGVTLADAAATTTTFTMPANAVEVTAVYEDIPHSHSFGTAWVDGGDGYHYHKCECGELDASTREAHSGDGKNCDGCGYVLYYTVTFNANGGSVSTTSANTDADRKLQSLPTPTRSGYKFIGWYTEKDDGDRITTETVFTADTTVYAQWVSNSSGFPSYFHEYDLRFETNGGTKVATVYGIFGGDTIDLTKYVTTREGYTFTGWYLDKALTEKVNKLKIVENTTVYAGWIVTNPFDDVTEKDAYYDDVVFVYLMGLMEGTGNNKFSPMKTLNRATIVTTLWRLSGAPVVDTAVTFTDLGNDWYTDAMSWAIENKIILGYGNGLCKPLADVTHEQLVAILYRYAVLCEYDVQVPGDTAADIAHSSWSDAEVRYAEYNGLFADIKDASAVANRAEIAGYLHRFCKLYEIEK